MRQTLRLLAMIALAASIAAAAPLPRPRLIVVISVDQMRYDYLSRFAKYENGGLHYLTSEGADFTHANYRHIPTETCPGHSIILSGRDPEHTGIVGNSWYDAAAGHALYCVADPASPLLDPAGGNGPGVSPRNFVGLGFGDQLQAALPGARVFSISLKDRAAVMLGGKHPAGGAFWFSQADGNFISSHYYFSRLPEWARQFDASHPADAYAGRVWSLLLGTSSPAYGADRVRFPHQLPAAAGPALYSAVYGSPFGDELLERFAETLIAANDLGQGAQTDLLAISFSSNDVVGHAYGPDSAEIADEQIRLDRTLGKLVAYVNGRLGAAHVLWALSADHGVQPAPEEEQALRHNRAARRVDPRQIEAAAARFLDAVFHQPADFRWFAMIGDDQIWFNRANLAAHRIDLAAAQQALERARVDGISGFYDGVRPAAAPAWLRPFLRNSYFAGRSGDVYYIPRQWTLLSAAHPGSGGPFPTSHGTPYSYDTHVPFLIAGTGVRARHLAAPVHVIDLAPTLARLIGIPWHSDQPNAVARLRPASPSRAARAPAR